MCKIRLTVFFRKVIAIPVVLGLACVVTLHAQERRVFEQSVERWNNQRAVSFYVTLNGNENKTLKVWDGLYVQILPVGHVDVKDGAFGYTLDLSTDAAGKERLQTTDMPAHGPRDDEIMAWQFRNSDNSGWNDVGPKNVNAPQDVRGYHCGNIAVSIRILEMELLNTQPGKTPSFSSLKFLVAIRKES